MPNRRANLKDIAEAASVSTATVDRVLNDRGRVTEATMERVRRAAEELGFPTGLNREDFLYRVLLQDPDHLYYRALGGAISREAEAFRRRGLRVEIEFLVETDDSLVAEKIDELSRDADGIAGVFVQNTLTLEAVSRAIERGKPVVTLLSDLRHPLRAAYVGLDNRTVGRTAGYVLGRFAKQPSGRVLVTSETMNYLGLEEREMGLRSVLAEKFPHLEMSSVIEKGSDRDAMVQRIADRVKDPSIVGVYNVGGRNNVIVDAMKLAGRRQGEVVYVGSELTEISRRLMIDGWMDAVISFPANRAGKAVIQAMLQASGRGDGSNPGSFQPLQIYFAENAVAGG